MKEYVWKGIVLSLIFLCFCTVTAKVVEEEMTPVVEIASVEEDPEDLSGTLVRLPTACLYDSGRGEEGFYYMKEEQGLWGKEWRVHFSVVLDGKRTEEWIETETSERMIVGYSSKPLKDGVKVKRVER